ncbi:hypothetical protein ACRC7T_14075 [Segnochrobactraceae bacterium EtOH-i3]
MMLYAHAPFIYQDPDEGDVLTEVFVEIDSNVLARDGIPDVTAIFFRSGSRLVPVICSEMLQAIEADFTDSRPAMSEARDLLADEYLRFVPPPRPERLTPAQAGVGGIRI